MVVYFWLIALVIGSMFMWSIAALDFHFNFRVRSEFHKSTAATGISEALCASVFFLLASVAARIRSFAIAFLLVVASLSEAVESTPIPHPRDWWDESSLRAYAIFSGGVPLPFMVFAWTAAHLSTGAGSMLDDPGLGFSGLATHARKPLFLLIFLNVPQCQGIRWSLECSAGA